MSNIQAWYDFILQQMAAESYLDQALRNLGVRSCNITQSQPKYL
jgi:hypothetical protein